MSVGAAVFYLNISAMNRRAFISTFGVAGVAATLQPRLLATETKSMLKLGIVGCGWYGGRTLAAFNRAGGCEVVSLCDVNTVALEKTLHHE